MGDPVIITTGDPRFKPTEPVTINGYQFVPAPSERDLASMDKMIELFALMGALQTDDFYDDLWNARNHLVPFVKGDQHFDDEAED